MARGVDDVDPVLGEVEVHPLPEAGRRRRGDGDAALLLLLHPVHGGRAVVHFADLVIDAGVVEDALGRRRLAGVDVRRDTDVPVALDAGSCGTWGKLRMLDPPAPGLPRKCAARGRAV